MRARDGTTKIDSAAEIRCHRPTAMSAHALLVDASMKTSSLFHLFASAVAAAFPLATGACGTATSTPQCVDQPHTVSLSTEAGATVDGGADGGLDCVALCHSSFCDLNADRKTVTCHTECTGRRPQGLIGNGPAHSPCTLGHYFAEVAHLEAASVNAFRILADELVRFGAPTRLVQAARRAKRDERRHVRLTGALARRFGATPRKPRVDLPRTRELVDIAIENAVEGCVRETFGALVAHWQAGHATDPNVRVAMARIARDETRHAALAWQTNAWMRTKLAQTEWSRVVDAMDGAVKEISERQAEPALALAGAAGIPGSSVSTNLAAVLRDRLWNGAALRNGRRHDGNIRACA